MYTYHYYYNVVIKTFTNVNEYLEYSNAFLYENYNSIATVADANGLVYHVNISKVKSFSYEANFLNITFDNDLYLRLRMTDTRQASDNYNYINNVHTNYFIDDYIKRRNKLIVDPSITEDNLNGLYTTISQATINAEAGDCILISDSTHTSGRVIAKTDVIYYCNNGTINTDAQTLFWIENCFNFGFYGGATINNSADSGVNFYNLNQSSPVLTVNAGCDNTELRVNLKTNNGGMYMSNSGYITNWFFKCRNYSSFLIYDQDGDNNADIDIINAELDYYFLNPDYNGSHYNYCYYRNMKVTSDNVLDSPLYNPMDSPYYLSMNFINYFYNNNSNLFRGVGATRAYLNFYNSFINTFENDIINNLNNGTFRQYVNIYGNNYFSNDYNYMRGTGNKTITEF